MLVDISSMPGMFDPVESTENEFCFGRLESWQVQGVVLDSTTVDSGSSPTTLLRRGLLLGKLTASGKYAEYDPAATDGTQVAMGILYRPTNMLNTAGTAVDKAGLMMWTGPVKAANVINLDRMARRQLAHRFYFDDGLVNESNYYSCICVKTADYTVLAADNNTLFTTRGAAGAVNFTLPTLARGLRFVFFNEADQNMTVTAGTADTMVVHNDLAADSIAFSTASEKVGGCIEVFANDNASKWLTRVSLGFESQTVTIAT